MRILAVTNLYPNPCQLHRAPFNRQQIRELAGRHPVRVIAPIAWTDELVARWTTGARLPAGRRVTCDGLIVDHPRFLFPPRVLRGRYGQCYWRSVRPSFEQALTEFRPDLVFATWAYPDGWAAVEFGRRAGLPVVIKVHGSDVSGLDAFPGRRRRTAEAVRRAAGVVAVSRDLAERVVALGAERRRVRVVYNGVDTDSFHPGLADQARARLGLEHPCPMILFIGNLVPVKGTEVLIEACDRLARDGVRFACYLIGHGPLRGRLERLIGRRGLGEHVRLVGPRPHDKLPDWYRAASVVVLPSYSEGVPNVLLEAAACGTPFVASRVGGVPEIAHLGHSRLVPPGDPVALAEALKECLADTRPRPADGTPPVRSLAEAASELADLFGQVIEAHRVTSPTAECPGARG